MSLASSSSVSDEGVGDVVVLVHELVVVLDVDVIGVGFVETSFGGRR